MFTTIFTFLLQSSIDHTKTSLTVKGAFVYLAGLLIALSGSHIDITPAIAPFVQFVDLALQLFGAGYAVYGAIRKIILSIRGQNVALIALHRRQ